MSLKLYNKKKIENNKSKNCKKFYKENPRLNLK